jgi:hypothetical protein
VKALSAVAPVSKPWLKSSRLNRLFLFIEAMDLSHTLLNSICEEAFYYCSELKSLKLPSSVQSAGEDAFYHCSKLVPSTISTSSNADNTPILAFLHKPQSERDALMLANPPIGEDWEDSDINDNEGDY